MQDVVGVDAADLHTGNELDDPAYVIVVQGSGQAVLLVPVPIAWSTSTGQGTQTATSWANTTAWGNRES